MRFLSTRGKAKAHTFEEAVLSPGYLSDGGLLMPETIPKISQTLLKSWKGLSLPDLCKKVMPFFTEDDVSQGELEEIIDKAYSRLPVEEVAALSSFSDGLNVLELSNTKTLAFKDLSTFILGRFLEYFLNKRKEHVTIVVGTSGDTGPSSIEAVRGLDWIDIVVLFPHGYCTHIQELQMITTMAENVHCISAEGSSDDLDLIIKPVILDQEFKTLHNLCTMNSINMIRTLVQVVNFFYGYLAICKTVGETVEIVVPTGAAGHITGGCIAYAMGLPVKLVSAVNTNDIIHRAITHGDYSKASRVIKTYSVAMDIQIPYNMERILFLFSNQDTSQIKKVLEEFESTDKTQIPEETLIKMQEAWSSYSCHDDQITKTMQRCWREHKYRVCPHTAVAVSYYFDKIDRHRMNNQDSNLGHTVCFATAHPAKFPEAAIAAGLEPTSTPYIESLSSMPTRFTEFKEGQDWVQMLREKIEDISRRL
ncbi:threonine synthase-like 2 [Asterias amurensis]|uniref:threonine synthase-like 2 n=1 Tax=Asterias amurensis TaxID=7602 RepID=UPI003AB38014